MKFWRMEREAKKRKKNEIKACCSDGDGGGGAVVVVVEERRCWEEMNREILSLIFVRIPSDEMARAVAFVCRSWRDAVAEPYCWSHIDVEEWCRRCNEPGVIDYAVRKIVRRSGGILRCLSAYRLSDFSFSFIAQSSVFELSVSLSFSLFLMKHQKLFWQLLLYVFSFFHALHCMLGGVGPTR